MRPELAFGEVVASAISNAVLITSRTKPDLTVVLPRTVYVLGSFWKALSSICFKSGCFTLHDCSKDVTRRVSFRPILQGP
jgi:hypothetical protein